MRTLFRRLYATIIAGLFLLLPVSLVIIIMLKVFNATRPVTAKVAEALGLHEFSGERAIVIGTLLLLCFFAGLLVRARRVGRFREWLEKNILLLIPGYEYIRMRMAETFGQDAEATDRAILARIDDGWAPGMLIERAADGRCTVFMPDVPQCSSGSVYIVESHQVKSLGVRYGKLNDCIRNYGKGLLALETNAKA